MNKEQIRDIFIEEATEIIEKLDIDIINFEDNPNDKDLLNELFRGVHTLKGSANSFGFTRLGQFVHHFEDVLDHYRNTDDVVNAENIDLFLMAVDIIKDVMWREVDGDENVPEKYDETLEGIKAILAHKSVDAKEEVLPDLASEFLQTKQESTPVLTTTFNEDDIKRFTQMLKDTEVLYHIALTLDDDIYFRGLIMQNFLNFLIKKVLY